MMPQGNAETAAQAQLNLHTTFNLLFGLSEGNWLVPGLVMVCKTTSHMANGANHQLSSKNCSKPQQQVNLQKVVPILQDSNAKSFNDRTEFLPGAPFNTMGSKKEGVLSIVNVLFGMYFWLKNLRLCKNLIEGLRSKETGTTADMVTYNHYNGRLLEQRLSKSQKAKSQKNRLS
jgi:hypothetical protein